MSSSNRIPQLIAAVSLTLAPMLVAVGQSSVAISPFVSYVPSAVQNPLAGLALTFGGTTGLALRGSADISVANPDKTTSATDPAGTSSTGGFRPWGADADAMLFLGGLGGGATVFSRSLSPYVFSGIGLIGGDSAGTNVVHNGWSYGAGAAIPLGFDADLFGEARWRMSQYVLPTSKGAPDSKSEMRFGLSFHVGGGSRQPAADTYPRRGRGHRMDDYDDEVVVAQPTIQPATATATAVNVNVPEGVLVDRGARRSTRDGRYEPVARDVSVMSASSTRVLTTARGRNGIVYRSRVASSQKAKVVASARSGRTSAATSSRRQGRCATSACRRITERRSRED